MIATVALLTATVVSLASAQTLSTVAGLSKTPECTLVASTALVFDLSTTPEATITDSDLTTFFTPCGNSTGACPPHAELCTCNNKACDVQGSEDVAEWFAFELQTANAGLHTTLGVQYVSGVCPAACSSCSTTVLFVCEPHGVLDNPLLAASAEALPYCQVGQASTGECHSCLEFHTAAACRYAHCPSSCSGHGECSQGLCTCAAGWTGVDCSSRESCSTAAGCDALASCDDAAGRCACPTGFVTQAGSCVLETASDTVAPVETETSVSGLGVLAVVGAIVASILVMYLLVVGIVSLRRADYAMVEEEGLLDSDADAPASPKALSDVAPVDPNDVLFTRTAPDDQDTGAGVGGIALEEPQS